VAIQSRSNDQVFIHHSLSLSRRSAGQCPLSTAPRDTAQPAR
jgi:hypothetical protein